MTAIKDTAAIKKNYKISNSQFLLSILIVLIHSSCLFMNIPGNPELQMVYGVNFATFIQLFLGEGICRIAVPLFMMISGYLFYQSFDGTWKSYGNKIKRRIFSLVIPYLFWSSLTFAVFYIAQKIFGLADFFATRNENVLSFRFLLDNIVLQSYDSPLWFCRYLIVFSVISIILYRPLQKFPYPILAFLLYLWIFNAKYFSFLPPNIRFDSIFFYFFGAVVALRKDIFETIKNKINRHIVFALFCLYLLLLVLRTVVLCRLDPKILLEGSYNKFFDATTKILNPLGIFVFWFSFDYVFPKNKDLWKVSKFSFMIFAAHHPIVSVVKKLIFNFVSYNSISSVLVYFLSAVVTIIVIMICGMLIWRFTPHIWKVTTGNR